jgi:hypothetical protein
MGEFTRIIVYANEISGGSTSSSKMPLWWHRVAVRPKIQMKPILGDIWIGYRENVDKWPRLVSWGDAYSVVGFFNDSPAQHRAPEVSE